MTTQERLAPAEDGAWRWSQSRVARMLGEHDPYLAHEIFAPVEREVTGYNLEVDGEIPPELDGLVLKNGPNPNPRMPDQHVNWYTGDGLVHGIDLQDGVARWYRSRWVRTRIVSEDLGTPVVPHPEFEPGTHLAMVPNTGNVNIVGFGGKIMALCESGLPYEMTSDLDTVCEYDFGGSLKHPMTSHPKIDPVSGELFGVGYSPFEPWLVYHRVDPKTMKVKTEPVNIKGPSMVHDIAITENFVIIPDLPLVADLSLLKGPRSFPWAAKPDYGCRIGVIPKNGSAADIQWCEADGPWMWLHLMNAYEEGDLIYLDVCSYSDVQVGDYSMATSGAAPTSFDRVTINRRTGKATREAMIDVQSDTPRLDDRRAGREYRYGFGTEWGPRPGGVAPTQRLIKYDVKAGAAEFHDFGPGRWCQEPVFVPAPNSTSDEEGWVLAVVGETGRDSADLAIIDATRFSNSKPTMVHLPTRLPYGFHGSWVPRSAVGG